MQDGPTAPEILASVAAFLRDDVLGQLSGATAFQLRVAANALDLVRRELTIEPSAVAREHAALEAVLSQTGTTAELTAELARRISNRTLDPSTPDVETLLWEITDDKLAVDQPGYAGLLLARVLRVTAGRTEPNEGKS